MSKSLEKSHSAFIDGMSRRKSDEMIIQKSHEKFDINELLDGRDLYRAFDNRKSCISIYKEESLFVCLSVRYAFGPCNS
jgi:hypothetical protein